MSDYVKTDADKQLRMKEIIKKLHAGAGVEEVKRDFASLIKGVSAEEVAAMEQSLVDEGFPVEEIQRLCEVHVEVFKGALEKEARAGAAGISGSAKAASRLPGHPLHSLREENRETRRLLSRLVSGARAWAWGLGGQADAQAALSELGKLVIHFARKENQLFPYLERHGFTGPSKVMWGKHDELRSLLKETEAAFSAARDRAGARAAFAAARKFAAAERRMLFMEEKILFPNALRKLSDREWAEIRKGEEAIGFAWVKPGAVYDAGIVLAQTAPDKASGVPSLAALTAAATPGAYSSAPSAAAGGAAAASADPGAAAAASSTSIPLNTGAMPADLIDLVLRSLPLDVSVTDENDKVLYYSDNEERLFPRSPAVIGRDVHNCHPQKSVAVVERILEAFRKGEKDKARFWIQMGPKFVVIEYRALRDAEGRFRGTLEYSYDASEVRALEGQRRLLEWE